MKKPIILLGLLLGTAPALLAQQDPIPTKPDAAARFEALNQEVQAAYDAWRTEMQKAAEEAKKAQERGEKPKVKRAIQMRPDLTPFVAKFQAAASDFAGTDGAVPFLVWLMQNDRDAAKAAATTLAEAHAASAKIAELGPMLQYVPRMVDAETAEMLMAALKAKNEDPNVLAWCALVELGETIETADVESGEYAAAKKVLLARAGRASDDGVKTEIQGKIDLREKLGTGSIAPDIEGVDLDGVAFKLSDYKGKVIFLDFWGDW